MKRFITLIWLLFSLAAICACSSSGNIPSGSDAAVPPLSSNSNSGDFTAEPEPEPWYLEAAAAAADLGLSTPEYTADSRHTDDLTVAQAIALCARIHAIAQGNEPSFSSDNDYRDYALSHDILSTGTFDDDARNITRSELASLLAHTLSDADLPPINTVVFSAITDVTMSDPYGPEIYTLFRAGVLTGSGKDGAFLPDTSISHAETAVIAVRMLTASQRIHSDLTEAAPLPDNYRHSDRRGVPTFSYINCSFPLATGLPKLTDAEIDWLIATEDYRLIADSITTLADCVNYYLRARYSGTSSDYSYNWFTSICGQQVMARRGGACGGMSNATAYILRNDYAEQGYVLLDGHVMIYLWIDGLYYLVDPALYQLSDPIFGIQKFDFPWGCGHEKAEYCAPDLQIIADSFAEHGYTTYTFNTYVSPGDMFPHTMEESNGTRIMYYPTGTQVSCWLTSTAKYKDVIIERYSEEDHQFHVIPTIDWTTGEDWVDESLIAEIPFPPGSTFSLRWDSNTRGKIQDGETITGALGEHTFSLLLNNTSFKHLPATSSDESIVSCSLDRATGRIVLTAHAAGECDITIKSAFQDVSMQIHWITEP